MAAIQPKGWWLVAYTAVVVGGLVGAILAQSGVTAEGLHLVLRATARTSLVLFLAAFVAASLRAIRPGGLADWLAENRRYLGISFAASHSFHFAAIIGLTRLADRPPDVVSLRVRPVSAH
jgi:methionine sulfoxide reductase heme-binding subunit